MESIYYIGLDVHKKSIVHCIKIVTGKIVCQGMMKVEGRALQQWLVERRNGSNHVYLLLQYFNSIP